MHVYVVIADATVWWSFAVNWALWDNIKTVVMAVMLLKEAFDFLYAGLCIKNALKQKTVNSSIAYYVYVLLHNAVKQTFKC
jgi:hypothetical protein